MYCVQQLTTPQSLNLDLTDLRGKLTKPLRPLWVTQESQLPLSPPTFSDCHPIILCTASRRVPGGEASEGGYIQGAGDDSESWAHGLTAPLFWQHKDELLATSEAEIPDLIKALIDRRADSGPAAATLIKPTTQLYIGTLEAADEAPAGFRAIVTCGAKSAMVDSSGGARHLHVACAPGKVGSRQLRNELAKVQSFVASVLRNNADADILVACSTGKDHSVGVALAILCLFSNDTGTLLAGNDGDEQPQIILTKQVIKQRLSRIMVSMPDANPSRATLQSVNAFLLG